MSGATLTRYLLDTHTLLWWFSDSKRLSRIAREVLSDTDCELFASAASGWEIATKSRLGRLSEFPAINSQYLGLLTRNGFRELPISARHGLYAGQLDHPHKDPFDRMLAAQSIIDELPILTIDPAIAALGAITIW